MVTATRCAGRPGQASLTWSGSWVASRSSWRITSPAGSARTSCTRTRVLGPGRRLRLMGATLYFRQEGPAGWQGRRVWEGWRLATTLGDRAARRLDVRDLVRPGACRVPVPGVRRVHLAGDGPVDLTGRLLQARPAAAVVATIPARTRAHRTARSLFRLPRRGHH